MDPLRTALAGSALCAVLLGVYGMRYEYQTVRIEGVDLMMRVNRYTGAVEKRTASGWKQVSPGGTRADTGEYKPCPPELKEQAKTIPYVVAFCNPY